MVTVYGEVVETRTRTALEWFEGWELTWGGCAISWGGEWATILSVSRDDWMVYFKCGAILGFAYPLPHLLEIGLERPVS